MKDRQIEIIRLRGQFIKTEIVPLRDDKYCTLDLFYYEKKYSIIRTVLDNYKDVCYFLDRESIDYEDHALNRIEQIKEECKNNENGN